MTDAASTEVLYTTPTWRSRGLAAARTPIVRGSAWILASTLVASAGGMVFWLIAARSATKAEVGAAAALFSSVNLVNYLTSLGLPVTVARFGGTSNRDSRVLFNWALLMTVVSSVLVTLLYLPFTGELAEPLDELGTIPGLLFFAAVAAGASVSVLVDMRLTVQRRWRTVTARIVAFSVARLPLMLVGPLTDSAFALFALAAAPPAISGVVVWWLTSPKKWRYSLQPLPASARTAIRYSGINYAGTLVAQAPFFVLPVLVALSVSSRQNAVFFVAWSMAVIIFVLPTNIVRVQMAEAMHGQDRNRQMRIALALNVGVGVCSALAIAAGAGLITTVYGSAYEDAADLLRLLTVAAVPFTITLVAGVHARVIDDTPAMLGIAGLFAVTVLGSAAVLLSASGTLGAAYAWLLGNGVTGVAAGIWLFRALRRERHVPSTNP